MMRSASLAPYRPAFLALLVLVCAACPPGRDKGTGEPAGPCPSNIEHVNQCVTASVRPVAPDHPLPPQAPARVVLYLDRSLSMIGYLDATNSDSALGVGTGVSNLRTTLNRLLALGAGDRGVVGFGEAARPLASMPDAQLFASVVSQGFYNEKETRTEDALALVRRDSGLAAIHLVVTDGRRDDGQTAIAQYEQIGELGAWWVGKGGVFAMAASMAPFRQVRGDRAGCQTAPSSTGRCPLYVFAFVPARAAERALDALDEVSDHLYAYPSPSDSVIRVTHVPVRAVATVDLAMVRQRPFVVGVRARGEPNQPVTATDTLVFDVGASAARFALDDSLAWILDEAPLRSSGEPAWNDVGSGANARIKPGALAVGGGRSLRLPLTAHTYTGAPPTLYRIRLSSTGRPRWLNQYEAGKQADPLRTYGLPALLTHLQPRPATLGGAFVVVY